MASNFKIPASTPNRVIVALNKKCFLFDRTAYHKHEDYLNGYLEKEEYDKIIKRLNSLTEECWKNKMLIDDINVHPAVDYLIYISLLMAIVFSFMTFLSTKNRQIEYFSIGFLFAIIGYVIITGLALYNFLRKPPEFLVLTEEFQEKIDIVLAEINKKRHRSMEFKFFSNKWFLEINLIKIVNFDDKKKVKKEEKKDSNEKKM